MAPRTGNGYAAIEALADRMAGIGIGQESVAPAFRARPTEMKNARLGSWGPQGAPYSNPREHTYVPPAPYNSLEARQRELAWLRSQAARLESSLKHTRRRIRSLERETAGH